MVYEHVVSIYRKFSEWLLKVRNWMAEGRGLYVGSNGDGHNSQDTFWRVI